MGIAADGPMSMLKHVSRLVNAAWRRRPGSFDGPTAEVPQRRRRDTRHEKSSLIDTSDMTQQGFAWLAPVPAEFGPGDTLDVAAASRLILYEDDRELGPPRAQHDTIRQVGAGAFSHWHDTLYFSTSDGSDPRTNGREYRIARRSLQMVVIALDGVAPETLHQYIEEGRLPTIAKIVKRSRELEIRTECELYGVSCWPCFASGLSVGSHGIHAFRPFRTGTLQLLESTQFRMPTPFWELAARAGISTCVLDAPHYPTPAASSGLEDLRIVEWAPHPPQRQPSSLPAELLPLLMNRYGSHPCPIDVENLPTVEDSTDHLACVCAGARKRATVINDLIRTTNPELLVAVFSEPHTAAHQWLHQETPGHLCFDSDLVAALGSPMRRVCEAVDGAIGKVIERLPPDTTVLLTCLGGERTTHGGSYLLHDLLVRLGHTVYPTFPDSTNGTEDANALHDYESPENFRLDWSKTRAFALPWSPEGYLRLNQQGREPYGTVAAGAETEQLLSRIESVVRALRRADTDEPAAKAVIRPQEQYLGAAAAAELPDLMVLWNNDRPLDAIESASVGRIENRDRAPRSAHCNMGSVFACGPLVAAGPALRGIHDYDLAPTILKLLGLDVPRGLDGRVISELIASKAAADSRSTCV